MPRDLRNIDDLTPDADNANLGTERGRYMLEQSLREVGAGRSIVVDAEGRVIAGNKTLEVAEALGLPIEVVRTDGTRLVVVQRDDLDLDNGDDKARRLAYFDNRSGQVGLEWDAAQMVADLEAGLNLDDMFKGDEMAAILEAAADALMPGEPPEPQIDKAEELREQWQTERGQVWEIASKTVRGKTHRVMCGDSTSAEDVARLMGGERASLCISSSPYGIGKEYESGGLDGWRSLIAAAVPLIAQYAPLVALNLADIKVGPDHREVHTYGELVVACASAGLPLIGTRIWSKGGAWSQGAYWLSSYRAVDEFEYIGLFGVADYREHTQADWRYRGVWDIPSVAANKAHSAAFPVELPRRLLELLTGSGSLAIDLFLGSGTTAVAAEQTGRLCYGMEISEAYTAVSLQRLADMGLEPQLTCEK